jgi:bacteriorhodopsin
MKDTLVQASIDTSLFIQVLTLFFNVWAFFLPVSNWDFALKEILGLETAVQIVELIFYGWYRSRILETTNDVTRFRYYDWFLTTPTMLFSTACFYGFLGHSKETETQPFSVVPFFQQESNWFLLMFLMNALMLLFGYLQEIGMISLVSSTVFGYLALLGSFGIVYRYASKIPAQQWLFRFMASTWSLYGVAALLPSREKNVSYNVLDVFAKNFYGLFLGYLIHQRKI